jgi:hypothetical protein
VLALMNIPIAFVNLRKKVLMPIYSYFLVVGSVLTGLLCYANNIIAPVPLPFSVSQQLGLPGSSRAPVAFVNTPYPEMVVTSEVPAVESNKPVKLVHERRPTRIVRQPGPQRRFAAYPPREFGSIW